jgi:hypothetical protein
MRIRESQKHPDPQRCFAKKMTKIVEIKMNVSRIYIISLFMPGCCGGEYKDKHPHPHNHYY